jgi:hypothetical protein
MPVSSYPRTAVQGSTNTNNPQNGVGLMLFNNSTQQYEAATAATFGGGGGGGDATAANQTTQIAGQTTQITEAVTANTYLDFINQQTKDTRDNLFDNGAGLNVAQLAQIIRDNTFDNVANRSVAQLLYDVGNSQSVAGALQDIKTTLGLINNELISLNGAITNGSQRTVLQDSSGNVVNVTSNALNVDTGA